MPDSTLIRTPGENQYKHPASGCIIGWNGDAWEVWDRAAVSLKAFGTLRAAEDWCDAQGPMLDLDWVRSEIEYSNGFPRMAFAPAEVVNGLINEVERLRARRLCSTATTAPRCEHGTFVGGMEMCHQCLDDGAAGDSTRCADVAVVLHPTALGLAKIALADLVKEGARRVLLVFDEGCDRHSIYIQPPDPKGGA